MIEKIQMKVVILILFILTLGTSFYFFQKYQGARKLLQNTEQSAQSDKEKIIAKLAKIIELPDEEATMAVVSDKEKLKDQAFFKNAQNGDRVFIFTNAKKAILYRPSSNKIIEVAPINLGSPSASLESNNSTASPTQSLEVKVAIYNGTKTVGLAAAAEKDLKEKLPFVNVVLKDNSTGDFSKTIVVDLKGNKKDAANQIAKAISGEVSSLPTGEKQPDADILVILGR